MERLAEKYGAALVVLMRPLPVLAEAAVLLLGATGLGWRPFLVALGLSNLGVALAYSVLGYIAHSQGELPLALAASVALPLAATSAGAGCGRAASRPTRTAA